jgi:adenylate cyclase
MDREAGAWKWLGALPLHTLIIAGLLALTVAFRIADPEPIARLRLAAFDTFLQLSPRAADPEFPVKIVAVDEASLKEVGQWPWPRNVLAKLIGRLNEAGAKAIAMDIVLPEADRLSPSQFSEAYSDNPAFENIAAQVGELPTLDAKLAAELARVPSVLAFAGENNAGGLPGPLKASFATAGDPPGQFAPSFTGSVSNLPILTKQARGLGAANWIPERDQIVRRVPLLIRVGETLYPSLALETLRIGLQSSTIFIKSSGGSGISAFGQQTGIELIRVGRDVMPTNGRGELWLKFAKPDPRRTISASVVLSDDFDRSLVAGRSIFIGATAIGLHDLRATPLNPSVPGVEMHAQALEQMLSGDHAVRPAYAVGLELSFLVIGGALVAWLLGRSGPVMAAVLGLAAIGAVGVGAFIAYSSQGLLFDPVYPSLALAAVYSAGSLTNFVRAEQERQRVRTAFNSYLAPELVEELVEHPEKLKLGGENREVTLLFADVRRFSALAEGRDAESLVAFVNRLFTPLSEAIMKERGTIDKYMGDAVMAFWNAPLADAEHAEHGCRAALRMLRELDDLNSELAREAKEAGASFEPIRIGIGLNTGLCCVGNVGSPERFDYSVLGDVVNVASRLEQLTKTYGVNIIVGEPTAKGVSELAFLEIDRVVPRGKSRAEAIYALLGDETLAQDPQFRILSPLFDRLRQAMERNDFQAARDALAACRDVGVTAVEPLLSRLSDQIHKKSG